MNGYPIDAVITWVDGDDPAHKAKRDLFRDGVPDISAEDVGAETRFRSVGEIDWCVASIRRYAPFVRKIFVVTDSQDPHIDGVEIVDHTAVASGYEDRLPLFNSLGIETLLWRIPGLSDRYIYFNDDVFLTAPCVPEDFFDGDRTVCYARDFSVPFAAFLRRIKPSDQFGFKDAMLNSARIAGEKWRFPLISHVPLAQRRDFFERFYLEHPDVPYINLECRFREKHQYNPQVLYYICARMSGELEIRPGKDALYLKPKDKPGYVDSKLKRFRESPRSRFCCLNSLDLASLEDRRKVAEWVMERLG